MLLDLLDKSIIAMKEIYELEKSSNDVQKQEKNDKQNCNTRYETATSQDTFYNLFKKLFHTYLNSDAKKASPY